MTMSNILLGLASVLRRLEARLWRAALMRRIAIK
jgi:hypothetical protein